MRNQDNRAPGPLEPLDRPDQRGLAGVAAVLGGILFYLLAADELGFLVVAPLTRGRTSSIVPSVDTRVTAGETVLGVLR